MISNIKQLVLKFFSDGTFSQSEKLDDAKLSLIREIKSRRLTYLNENKLTSLALTCKKIENNGLEGTFIEAGCALGGSTILISKQKSKQRDFFVFDVFGMIPPPTEDDSEDVHERYQTIVKGDSKGIGDDEYYGYQNDLKEIVRTNLSTFDIDCKQEKIHLIEGLLQDTMSIEKPVAFAHIDVDWYEPVKTSLERIFPRLVQGGSIILDDYHDWGGVQESH